jgi:hypothetical protein
MAVTIDQIQVLIGAQTKELEDKLKRVDTGIKKTGSSANSAGGLLKKLGPAIAATFSVAALGRFTKELVTITGKFEALEAQIKTALGSGSGAKRQMDEIVKFAARTPFQIDKLTEAWVGLANRGVRPTMKEMENLGDLSAALGKPMDLLTGAVMDAVDPVRWRNLGIVVSREGSRMTGSFKGMQVEVEATTKGALEMATAFGQMEGVAGGMAAVSLTVAGKLSNLQDNIQALFKSIGNRSSGVIKGFLDFANEGIGALTAAIDDNVSAVTRERNAVLGMFGVLSQANIATATREAILKRLAAEYPEYLRLMGDEQTSVEKARDVYKELNTQYRQRLKLAVAEKTLAKDIDASVKAVEKMVDAELEREEIRKRMTIEGSGATFMKVASFEPKEPALIVTLIDRYKQLNQEIAGLTDQEKAYQEIIARKQAVIDKIIPSIKDYNTEVIETAVNGNDAGEAAKGFTDELKKLNSEMEIANLIAIYSPFKDLTKDLTDLAPKLLTADQLMEGNARAMKEMAKETIEYADAFSALSLDNQNAILNQLNAGINMAVSGFSNLFSTILGGGNILKAFGQMIKNLIARLVAMAAVSAILAAISGGGSAVAGGIKSAFGGNFGDIFKNLLGFTGTQQNAQGMASGGIAYGPTRALIGEYAGASSNPEIVAPLDRLKGMMGSMGGMGGNFTFKLVGRDLIAAIDRNERFTFRTST